MLFEKVKKKPAKTHGQMSETFACAIFLILSGGFQDAYTYCCRDHVFANAQTGNIVLMSSYLFRGEWKLVLRYLIPLICFVAGIYIAEVFHQRYKNMVKVHWRQIILLFEIVLLLIVGFIPQTLNILANSIVSFVCAMQIQTFRKVDGHVYASTMCIGNIRSGTEALCAYFHTRDKMTLNKALKYYSVIALFAVGAGIGSILTESFSEYAIWVSSAFLSVSFCMMFMKDNS